MIQKSLLPIAYLIYAIFCYPHSTGNAQEIIEKKAHESTTLIYPPVHHAPLHKATAVHLFAFMALIGRTDVTPSDPQGVAATRLLISDDPQNKNDDDDLTVYGVNSGQNNIIFNSSMQSIDIYEGKGPKQKLKKPRGIACNEKGDVYVADTGHDRIVHLFNPGSYLAFVEAMGKRGSKFGEFSEPHGIAVGTDGKIFVTDTGNDRIQVFDNNMKFLYSIGDKNDSTGLSVSMSRPEAIAFTNKDDPNSYFKDEFLIVTDLNNTRIRKLSPDGRFIAAVNSTDYGYQQVYLSSVAIDYYSNVWVTDIFNHCIHKFDRDLHYITSFGRIGDGDGQFFEPRGIAIGKKFGQVFIADKNSAQYYHIGTDIINFNISLQDSFIRFDFELTEYSKVTAKILDERNRPVAVLYSNRSMALGAHTLTWDRRVNAGLMTTIFPNDLIKRKLIQDSLEIVKNSPIADSLRSVHTTSELVKSGLYKIRIEAKTHYFYNRYFTKKLEVEFAF
jgi:DNA-binding beta-propeller fold protein YncE